MNPGTLAPRRGTHAWKQLRHAWQLRIDTNNGWHCRRCLGPIPPLDPNAWQLGHPDDTTNPTDRILLVEIPANQTYHIGTAPSASTAGLSDLGLYRVRGC